MQDKILALREVLLAGEFFAGLIWGLVAALASCVAARRLRLSAIQPAPLAGAALVVASLGALQQTRGVPLSLLAGVTVLALAGGAIAVLRPPSLSWPLWLLPGAALVAAGSPAAEGPIWINPVAYVAVALGGSLATGFARADRERALGPGVVLGTAVGVFLTVPDTEEALVLMAAALPLAATGWPLRCLNLGPPAASVWVGLVVWTAITGGITRPAAILGGIASLGVLVLEPLARAIASHWVPATTDRPMVAAGLPPGQRPIVVVAATHAVSVLIASRVAGLQQSTPVAAAVLVITGGVALGVLMRPRRAR